MTYSDESATTTGRSAAMERADLANGEGGPRTARCALIAVDDGPDAVDTARAALRLFGPGVRYVLVNVGRPEPIPWATDPVMWGTVPPALVVLEPTVETRAAGLVDDPVQRAADDAQSTASNVATSAGLLDAEPVGTIGDPADAICAVADEHGADVIVLGNRQRSWLSRLLSPSVTTDVLRHADRPVLVVP